MVFSDDCIGFWQWIKLSFLVRYNRLMQRIANDPRTDIILPRSVRKLGRLLAHGDTKVMNDWASFNGCLVDCR